MEPIKELTIEEVQAELGKTLSFFNAITQQLIKRYNDFHRLCNMQEDEIRKIVDTRLDYLTRKNERIWDLYKKEAEKIQNESDYILKKMQDIKKVIERKPRTAVQQAKIDKKLDSVGC
jgi:endonuclease III